MKFTVRLVAVLFILFLCYYFVQRWIVDKTAVPGGFISILLLLCALGYLMIALLENGKSIGKKTAQNLLLLLFSFSLMLLASEFVLRAFAKNLQSYGERNGRKCYASAYRVSLHVCDSCGGGYFFINSPNGTEEFYKPEFHYLHKYNSLGLRDHEFKEYKDSGEFRIIGLGDSFTEGVGTSEDSTWLKQLEGMLNTDSNRLHHYTTLNGGAHGSDLIFSYDLLVKCLLKYHPDLVILNLNSTDVGDIISRGVEERKNIHNGYIEGRGPWWEYLYGSSYIVRLIVMNGLHYNWELLSPKQQEEEKNYALNAIAASIRNFEQLAREKHFSFLLVIQPLQNELKENVLSRLHLDSAQRHIDLAPYFTEKVEGRHEPLRDYYWPVDGHFTAKGYQLEASEICRNYFLNSQH
jgi:lysophospholipase L1-like esterase